MAMHGDLGNSREHRMKTYELRLPVNYHKVADVQFDDASTGLLSDVKSVLPGVLLIVSGWLWVKPDISQILFSSLLFAGAIYPYFCLHELIHGLIYKLMSVQHIRIGFNKSGAYCAVPDVFLYRKAAVMSAAAPLAVFSLLFAVMEIWAFFVNNWLFLFFGMLLTFHLLACRSDVHLLRELNKYKSGGLLVQDKGALQSLYLPNEMSGIS